MAAPSAKLVGLRKQLDAKRAGLHEVFEAAGAECDFAATPVLEMLGVTDTKGAVAKVQEWNKEIETIFDSAKEQAELEDIGSNLGQVAGDLNAPAQPIRLADPLGAHRPVNRIGDMISAHDGFLAYKENKTPNAFTIENYGIRELRATLFETGAGWDPEDIRIGRLVDGVTRPIQILDIIPVGQTGMSTIKYMEETTRTHAAAEVAEGVAVAESTFVLAEQTSEVRKIGDSIPVTDEQLEDVAMVMSYLNQRLTFGLRQRLDNQVIQGNGTPPNLEGILNVTGIQTQAKGGDPIPDAIYKALTKVRVTGRAQPDNVLLHQNDWQEIRLLRTADGIYIWGSPSEAGPERIWGLPVVQSDVLTEGTGIVGDFGNFSMIFERRGIDIQVGYIDTQFTEGKRTIRADLRLAFVTFRPAAFATVTGI